MHIVVLERTAKGDPEAYYYGSMAKAVAETASRTPLFSVVGGVFNEETRKMDWENIEEQFIEAWEAQALVRCEEAFKEDRSGDFTGEYGFTKFLDHKLDEPPFVVAPVTSVRRLGEQFQQAAE